MLSRRQRQILSFIDYYTARRGAAPTAAAVGRAVGLSGVSVGRHVGNLRRAGVYVPAPASCLRLFNSGDRP